MKLCQKCGNEFEPSKGLINFCSLKCRNSRVWSEEDKKKKSNSAKNSEKVRISNQNKNISLETKIKLYQKVSKTKLENLLNSDFNILSNDSKRKIILLEQNNKCNKCGLDSWLGEKLVLELEHKDGDRNNGKRENLECICPNCHSLTKTWRGRNKNNIKVSDKELLLALKSSNSIRKALIQVNLTPKGGNYKRCKKLLEIGSW